MARVSVWHLARYGFQVARPALDLTSHGLEAGARLARQELGSLPWAITAWREESFAQAILGS